MIHARGRGHFSFKVVRCLAMPPKRKRSNCSRFLFVCNQSNNNNLKQNYYGIKEIYVLV